MSWVCSRERKMSTEFWWGNPLEGITWKDWKEMGDNAKACVRYQIWDVYGLVLQVVTLLPFLNGYCLRGTSHPHDQIVAYCEKRKGVLQTLSSNLCVCLGVKAKLLSCNRTQSRAVTGLLTGHNTLRRHLHLMGLSDSLLCRRCGAADETSAHILCECVAPASLRHAYLGSFLEPGDIESISLGAILNFDKATGLL
jgi:hypothetical protein